MFLEASVTYTDGHSAVLMIFPYSVSASFVWFILRFWVMPHSF
jgi:hypothetical protein